MGTSPADKAAAFRRLHEAGGIFVMPNAWDAGTARLLAAAGFPAIATTSVGVAATLGLPDYQGALSRDDNLAAAAMRALDSRSIDWSGKRAPSFRRSSSMLSASARAAA